MQGQRWSKGWRGAKFHAQDSGERKVGARQGAVYGKCGPIWVGHRSSRRRCSCGRCSQYLRDCHRTHRTQDQDAARGTLSDVEREGGVGKTGVKLYGSKSEEMNLIDWRGCRARAEEVPRHFRLVAQLLTVVQLSSTLAATISTASTACTMTAQCQSIMCFARPGPTEDQLVSLRTDDQVAAPIAASHRRHGAHIRPPCAWSSLPSLLR